MEKPQKDAYHQTYHFVQPQLVTHPAATSVANITTLSKYINYLLTSTTYTSKPVIFFPSISKGVFQALCPKDTGKDVISTKVMHSVP